MTRVVTVTDPDEPSPGGFAAGMRVVLSRPYETRDARHEQRALALGAAGTVMCWRDDGGWVYVRVRWDADPPWELELAEWSLAPLAPGEEPPDAPA